MLPEGLVPLLLGWRRRIGELGYSSTEVRRVVGVGSLDEVGILNYPVVVERAAADASPAGCLIRLFFLELPQPLAAVCGVLGDSEVDALLRRGLLRRVPGSTGGRWVRARLRLDPIGDQVFLSDLRFTAASRTALGLPPGDEVYPPSSDSVLLAQIVKPGTPARILDLCTGSGVQGLGQAAHAKATVAVDINPRAVALARLNAGLNEVERFDVLEGNLYAPVRGQGFDVIVANPPFVMSPYDDAPSFHAGGPRGDRVLRQVIAGFDRHLRPRGRGYAVAHVGLRDADELPAVAQKWFASFPGRALVLSLEVGTALDLAAAQALFAIRRGTAAYTREIRKWLDYLRRHRMTHVALILVVADKRGPRGVEVVDASPRILPLPMTPGPEQRVAQWLSREPSRRGGRQRG